MDRSHRYERNHQLSYDCWTGQNLQNIGLSEDTVIRQRYSVDIQKATNFLKMKGIELKRTALYTQPKRVRQSGSTESSPENWKRQNDMVGRSRRLSKEFCSITEVRSIRLQRDPFEAMYGRKMRNWLNRPIQNFRTSLERKYTEN